jgi:hypothetical protein
VHDGHISPSHIGDEEQQERSEIDRQAQEIAMEVSTSNSEVFARIIGARFTAMKATLQ